MADYYGNNDWRDYLAHYGVKGMKWRKHKKKDLNSALGDAISKISDSADTKRRNVFFNARKYAVRRRVSGLKSLSGNLSTLKEKSGYRSKNRNTSRVQSLVLKTSNSSKVRTPLITGKRKAKSRDAIVRENLLRDMSEQQVKNGTTISKIRKSIAKRTKRKR